jgi:hypothetical protein
MIKWIGGVMTAVIISVVTAIVIPEIIPSDSVIKGQVYNSRQDVSPIANAVVIFTIHGSAQDGTFRDSTDDHGAYAFDVSGLSRSSSVVMSTCWRWCKAVPRDDKNKSKIL